MSEPTERHYYIDFKLEYFAFWGFFSILVLALFTDVFVRPIVFTDPMAQQIAACELVNHAHQPGCIDKIKVDNLE